MGPLRVFGSFMVDNMPNADAATNPLRFLFHTCARLSNKRELSIRSVIVPRLFVAPAIIPTALAGSAFCLIRATLRASERTIHLDFRAALSLFAKDTYYALHCLALAITGVAFTALGLLFGAFIFVQFAPKVTSRKDQHEPLKRNSSRPASLDSTNQDHARELLAKDNKIGKLEKALETALKEKENLRKALADKKALQKNEGKQEKEKEIQAVSGQNDAKIIELEEALRKKDVEIGLLRKELEGKEFQKLLNQKNGEILQLQAKLKDVEAGHAKDVKETIGKHEKEFQAISGQKDAKIKELEEALRKAEEDKEGAARKPVQKNGGENQDLIKQKDLEIAHLKGVLEQAKKEKEDAIKVAIERHQEEFRVKIESNNKQIGQLESELKQARADKDKTIKQMQEEAQNLMKAKEEQIGQLQEALRKAQSEKEETSKSPQKNDGKNPDLLKQKEEEIGRLQEGLKKAQEERAELQKKDEALLEKLRAQEENGKKLLEEKNSYDSSFKAKAAELEREQRIKKELQEANTEFQAKDKENKQAIATLKKELEEAEKQYKLKIQMKELEIAERDIKIENLQEKERLQQERLKEAKDRFESKKSAGESPAATEHPATDNKEKGNTESEKPTSPPIQRKTREEQMEIAKKQKVENENQAYKEFFEHAKSKNAKQYKASENDNVFFKWALNKKQLQGKIAALNLKYAVDLKTMNPQTQN
jgi:hypothetical protein